VRERGAGCVGFGSVFRFVLCAWGSLGYLRGWLFLFWRPLVYEFGVFRAGLGWTHSWFVWSWGVCGRGPGARMVAPGGCVGARFAGSGSCRVVCALPWCVCRVLSLCRGCRDFAGSSLGRIGRLGAVAWMMAWGLGSFCLVCTFAVPGLGGCFGVVLVWAGGVRCALLTCRLWFCARCSGVGLFLVGRGEVEVFSCPGAGEFGECGGLRVW